MIPVVALVGRPNVGKSTLFNVLTKTRDALVADFPGLTRDRQYGEAKFQGKPFIVVDTGGIGVDDIAVDALMSKQSALALEEADIVLFMVDARAGLTGIDQNVAASLRKLSKPVYLIVNKIDGGDEDIAMSDFQSLGFSACFGISAAHGRGLTPFLSYLTQDFIVPVDSSTDEKGVKIAFIGRPNVGKSTLINRLLGEDRVVVYDMPGTTRDSIAIPFTRNDKPYTLIDTAGIRRRGKVDEKIEKFSIVKTLQAIKESAICLLLIDAKEGLTEQDLHLLGFIIEAGRALVIVVNKWDGLDEDKKNNIKSALERRLQFVKYAKVRFISALHGTGVGLLFKDIDAAYASAIQDLSTPRLTRMLQDFMVQHAPPLVHGRRIKMRYAHAGGHNPPIVVIHGNQLDHLPDSYKRYLISAFIEKLGMVGTPLRVEFKNSENPYKDKRNTLTPRQLHKKKRMMRFVKKK